jgi:hypothetical protein
LPSAKTRSAQALAAQLCAHLFSHSDGDPNFEAGESWLTNPEIGQPLKLICQLGILEETPPRPFAAQVVLFCHNYP